MYELWSKSNDNLAWYFTHWLLSIAYVREKICCVLKI